VVERFDRQQMIDCMLARIERAETLARTAPRPPVDCDLGLASASLAIEYLQFREALLRLAPVRWSSAWLRLARPTWMRAWIDWVDRQIYVLRREVMWRIRRALGREYNR